MSKLQPVLTCVCGAVWEGEMMVHPPRNQAVECMCGICKLGKREWEGLTDKQLEEMAEKYVTNCYFDTLKYARAVEAELKEKNFVPSKLEAD
jgi:hypothetical protein